ncbi:hypothetical protein JOB18_027011 [Solea senegalensis]|uniref:Uncharacterized protein n=1 Tax=Solea senegalensis TaxID=28829 RepID=A0AAV6R853_SOLSE|nr:hypothetical protein JOB18_027011 [Solea senegalensis]
MPCWSETSHDLQREGKIMDGLARTEDAVNEQSRPLLTLRHLCGRSRSPPAASHYPQRRTADSVTHGSSERESTEQSIDSRGRRKQEKKEEINIFKFLSEERFSVSFSHNYRIKVCAAFKCKVLLRSTKVAKSRNETNTKDCFLSSAVNRVACPSHHNQTKISEMNKRLEQQKYMCNRAPGEPSMVFTSHAQVNSAQQTVLAEKLCTNWKLMRWRTSMEIHSADSIH